MIATITMGASAARAQAPAETAPAAAPPAEGTPPVVAQAAPDVPAVTPSPPAPAAAAPPPVIAPPAPPPPAPAPEANPDYKKINVGFGLRAGGRFQNPNDTSSLNDFGLDEIYVESRFSGQLTPVFAWQANFNASIPINTPAADATFFSGPGGNGAGTGGGAAIMDMIAKIEPHSAFHVWVGRMLVPSDRSNFSGPWFMSPWQYPGIAFAGGFAGPNTGPAGRDNGVTVWGEFVGGKAKYYLSAFKLNDSTVSPLYSGRFNLALIGSESGFYHSSTYYGSQDIVAIGGGFQFQQDGLGMGTDYSMYNVDVLAEKNFGPGGVGTVEGGFYGYGEAAPFDSYFYALASWLTPSRLGIGKLQPLVRWQQTASPDPAPTQKIFDAYLTYVIDDYFLRLAAGYQYRDIGVGDAANAVLLGIQMQR